MILGFGVTSRLHSLNEGLGLNWHQFRQLAGYPIGVVPVSFHKVCIGGDFWQPGDDIPQLLQFMGRVSHVVICFGVDQRWSAFQLAHQIGVVLWSMISNVVVVAVIVMVMIVMTVFVMTVFVMTVFVMTVVVVVMIARG
ncbi:MAG: hypothetical protein ACYTGL_19160 [Planctomycetota bacterium]